MRPSKSNTTEAKWVVCGAPKFAPDKVPDTLTKPVVLVEVASKSTSRYDQANKFLLYKDIPSLRHHLLVESTVPLCSRVEENVWKFFTFEGLEAAVPLPTLGVELPPSEIYRKVPLA